MKFFHHNLLVELNDDWWVEADMVGFVPKSKSYRAPSPYGRCIIISLFVFANLATSTASPSDLDNGNTWTQYSAAFKLGFVTGYARAMDNASSMALGQCIGIRQGLQKPESIKTVCLSESGAWDYDGITMSQFVSGIDAFYRDFRNMHLSMAWAMEYVRDQIKGKPPAELEKELVLWRQCTADAQAVKAGRPVAHPCAAQ